MFSIGKLLSTSALMPALVSACLLSPAAQADISKGADSFDANCAECHSVASPPRNKKGPSLFGIIGRASGQVPDYSYSDALKASGITWTPEKVDAYITAPKSVIPGGKMKFDGLADAAERKDLLEFLNSKK